MRINARHLVISLLAAATLLLPLAVVGSAQAKGKPQPSGTTAPAATGPVCGDVVLLKPDGSPWTCSFADDFDGRSLDATKWTPQLSSALGQTMSGECRVDSPSNLSVSKGSLHLTARRAAEPFFCSTPTGGYWTRYSAAGVSSGHKFSQAYGRVEMRVRFPSTRVAGAQATMWLYPQQLTYGAWPASGEIDLAEWYSVRPDYVMPLLHYLGDSDDPMRANWFCTVGDVTDFHTYAMVWTPQAISFVYDGKTCMTNSAWSPDGLLTPPAPFDKPFFLLMNQGVGANGNAVTDDTPLPATTDVDYVRVWR
jgi:beta-glucanase (GH16 family)